MPKHRGLSLKKLVRAVPWDLFERYFEQFPTEEKTPGWKFINSDAMQDFLDDPQNAGISALIYEDFRRINDICIESMNLVVKAYHKFSLTFNQDAPALELAMRLFLDAQEAFDYAWTLYLLYQSPAKMTYHHLDCPPIDVRERHVADLRAELTSWFAGLAKGDICHVAHFEEYGDLVFRISHGSYYKTIAHWEGDQIEVSCLRPAYEDIIIYHPRESLLTIRATLQKEREEYLKAFAICVANNLDLIESVSNAPVFSLVPFQDNSFDFTGDGVITNITITRIKLRLYDTESTVIDIRSKDVLQSLQKRFQDLSLASGELQAVRLKIELQPEGEHPTTVTFEIEPPCRTDLAQKRYASLIESYLQEQRIKLL